MLSTEDRAHYEVLLHTRWFAGPAVGIAAVEPASSKAVRSLATHPGGAGALKYVLIRAPLAGKLYALIGLRHTSPWFFRLAVQPFRFWPGSVPAIFGCVGERRQTSAVVAAEKPLQLASGETAWDLADVRSTKNPGELDILHGGYTSLFLDIPERPPAPTSRR